MRRLFELACRYSGQVLSYNKMLGQLQDAGNTTTLAHCLDLEVKSGAATGRPTGLDAFHRAFAPGRRLAVGGNGIPVEEFLGSPVERWVRP